MKRNTSFNTASQILLDNIDFLQNIQSNIGVSILNIIYVIFIYRDRILVLHDHLFLVNWSLLFSLLSRCSVGLLFSVLPL